MFALEHQPRYLPTAETPDNFRQFVVAARSSDSERSVRRIDDVISLNKTSSDEYPVEVTIGFSNPSAGLDPEYVHDLFQSSYLDIQTKFDRLSQKISQVRPPTNYSLNQGIVRGGLLVSQRLNIDTGNHLAPEISLAALLNKQKMSHSQLNRFIWSDLTDRDTRSYQESLRTALFFEQNRLNPYAHVTYDRSMECVLVNGSPASWLAEVGAPANTIVQEFTVNASASMAAFAYWHDIPVIYKGTFDSHMHYIPMFSTQPLIHRYYNLTAYLNISRQLRSLIDKVNGLQITSYLRNYQLAEVPISASGMQELCYYICS